MRRWKIQWRTKATVNFDEKPRRECLVALFAQWGKIVGVWHIGFSISFSKLTDKTYTMQVVEREWNEKKNCVFPLYREYRETMCILLLFQRESETETHTQCVCVEQIIAWNCRANSPHKCFVRVLFCCKVKVYKVPCWNFNKKLSWDLSIQNIRIRTYTFWYSIHELQNQVCFDVCATKVYRRKEKKIVWNIEQSIYTLYNVKGKSNIARLCSFVKIVEEERKRKIYGAFERGENTRTYIYIRANKKEVALYLLI